MNPPTLLREPQWFSDTAIANTVCKLHRTLTYFKICYKNDYFAFKTAIFRRQWNCCIILYVTEPSVLIYYL